MALGYEGKRLLDSPEIGAIHGQCPKFEEKEICAPLIIECIRSPFGRLHKIGT